MKYFKAKTLYTRQIVLGIFLLSTTTIFSQDLGIEEAADNLLTQVKSALPLLCGLIFLVSVLMNIGKITGGDRDYKGFFVSIGLWVVAIVLVGALFNYIIGWQL